MTALGSVQSLSKRAQKKSQQGNEGMGWAKEATFLHSAACLEIELQGYITVSQSYPGL